MSEVINITLADDNDIINVYVSDAVITQGGGGTFINGFQVTKGAGNTGSTIEIGDKVIGWIDNIYVAGVVTNIPVNDPSDVNTAIQGEYL